VTRALSRCARRRLGNSLAALSPVLRFELAALALISMLLLFYYAGESYYALDPGEPGATLVTRLSRVVAGSLALATWALVLLARGWVTRAPDRAFLQATPVPARSLAARRADELAVGASLAFVLGLGLLLPPADLGQWNITGLGVLVWATWLWAASQMVAFVFAWALEGRWGPGGIGGFAGRLAVYLAIPLSLATYVVGRELTALIIDPRRSASLAITAVLGIGFGWAFRLAALRAAEASRQAELRQVEHQQTVEWAKERARVMLRRRLGFRPGRGPLAAFLWKDAALVWRHRSIRGHWLVAVLLIGLAFAIVLRPGVPPPLVFAGLIIVLAAAATGMALLLQWSNELPGWTWGSPASRAAQWAARGLPGLALVLGAAVGLSVVAAIRAGFHEARVVGLWTGVSGASLVVAAANLGSATPPRSTLGQNLFGLGLFSAILLGAVFPGWLGWVTLALFAAYTFRSLARDPRPG
jgi:hypothetical protein